MKEFEKWFAKAENDLLSIANNLHAHQTPVMQLHPDIPMLLMI